MWLKNQWQLWFWRSTSGKENTLKCIFKARFVLPPKIRLNQRQKIKTVVVFINKQSVFFVNRMCTSSLYQSEKNQRKMLTKVTLLNKHSPRTHERQKLFFLPCFCSTLEQLDQQNVFCIAGGGSLPLQNCRNSCETSWARATFPTGCMPYGRDLDVPVARSPRSPLVSSAWPRPQCDCWAQWPELLLAGPFAFEIVSAGLECPRSHYWLQVRLRQSWW